MRAKQTIASLVFLLMTLAVVGIAYAAPSIEPTAPTTMTYVGNSTVGGQSGTAQSHQRGYIHYMNIDESAPTQSWKAYVGNITGEYALQDASGNAIYDWTITSVTGELYATKEAPTGGSGIFAGGIPTWTAVSCANSTMITEEEAQFNHTAADEDSYSNTFKNGNNFNLTTFYAGEKQVTDSSVIGGGAGGCYGAYMNVNNADQVTDFQEVVLTDGTYQDMGGSNYDYDIIYAALLENNQAGFDNRLYDFQMLLPEDAADGATTVTTYYFYVELI
ncbi:TPA: hypothetical protein HA265_02190 [Candidatus Woesearchaeota archaeon]|nr:hypothetical protein [Candidatus Woesearchaeota archaeon]